MPADEAVRVFNAFIAGAAEIGGRPAMLPPAGGLSHEHRRHSRLPQEEAGIGCQRPGGPPGWRHVAGLGSPCILARILGTGPHTTSSSPRRTRPRLESARDFVRQALPGFYVVSGSCGATGHASVGPDYDGPDGERLLRNGPGTASASAAGTSNCPTQTAPTGAPRNPGVRRPCTQPRQRENLTDEVHLGLHSPLASRNKV